MNVAKAQSVLMESLLPYFEHKRYAPVVAWHQFRRETSFGHSAVLFGVSPSPNGVLVEAFVGIRYQAVEAVLADLFGYGSWYGAQSHTLVVSWAHLWPEVLAQRYPCRNEAEMDALADLVVEFMDARGFDFLHTLRTLEALCQLFNEDHLRCAVLTNRAWQRCFRALVLASLQRCKNLTDLYRHHRATLLREGAAAAVLEKFDQVYIHIGNSVAK
jgi:hypothetical protein